MEFCAAGRAVDDFLIFLFFSDHTLRDTHEQESTDGFVFLRMQRCREQVFVHRHYLTRNSDSDSEIDNRQSHQPCMHETYHRMECACIPSFPEMEMEIET